MVGSMTRHFRKLVGSGTAFCAIGEPGGPAYVAGIEGPSSGETLTAALLVGLFAAAGVWMFRRWGGQPSGSEVPDTPAALAEPVESDERRGELVGV